MTIVRGERLALAAAALAVAFASEGRNRSSRDTGPKKPVVGVSLLTQTTSCRACDLVLCIAFGHRCSKRRGANAGRR